MRKLVGQLWRLLRSPMTRIFVLLVLQHSPVLCCPIQCDCPRTSNGTLVLCNDKNLDTLPQGIPSDTFLLDLRSNNIGDISSSSSSNFPNIAKILLDNNVITTLYGNIFKRYPNVEVLSLDSNVINDIQANAFSGLHKLTKLDLQNNQLTSLKPQMFDNLTLTTLNLERNNIDNIDQSVFTSVKITNLKMDYNNISMLSQNMLQPLKQTLKQLSVSYNRRPLQVDKLAFQGFNLEELKLCYNGITNCSFLSSVDTYRLDLSGNQLHVPYLQTYRNLQKVGELILVNNSIQALDASYFEFLTNIKILDLTNNKLSTLAEDTFVNNAKLESLLLNSNKLVKVPKGLGRNCPKLNKLMLASNHISSITADLFASLQLQELDLSYNLIQVFEEPLKGVFDSILMLALNGNPFHCNCEMKWFRKWLDTRIYNTGADKCHSPNVVNIYDLKAEQFICKPPVLLYTNPDENVTEGSDVLLSCTASGDPAPEIVFTDPSGEGISISPQKNRTKTKTYAMWQINSIPYYKAGYYICKASNVIASVTGSICVSVESTRSDAGMKACAKTTTTSTSTSSTTTIITTSTISNALNISTNNDFQSIPPSTTIKPTETTGLPPSNMFQSTGISVTTSTFKPTENQMVDKEDSSHLILIITLSSAGAFLVVVIIIVAVCYARKKKTNGMYTISHKGSDILEYHKMNGKPPNDVTCNGHALV